MLPGKRTIEGDAPTSPNAQTPEVRALSAIHDEVLRIVNLPMSEELSKTLDLIRSICQFGHDLRSPEQKKRTEEHLKKSG